MTNDKLCIENNVNIKDGMVTNDKDIMVITDENKNVNDGKKI